MTEIVDGIPQPVVLTQEDIDVIGEIYVKATYFEIISSGTTSGQVSKPAGGGADVSFVMDEWGVDTDALVTTVDGGKPTFRSPVDGGGATITTTFDTDGNFVLSATPVPAADHAIVYVYKCFLKNFNADESIFETEIGAGGDHGLLTGLADDDHTQYLNLSRANTWFSLKDLADLGSKDHADLDLLGADDHTQYHTDARADTWFAGKDLADLGTKNHADLDLLGADDHSQYALLAGRNGGQTLIGGTLTTQDLVFQDNVADGNFATLTQDGFHPGVDNTLDLGENSTPLRWRNLWLSGSITACDLLPSANAVCDLGENSTPLAYRTLYLQNDGGAVINLLHAGIVGQKTEYTFAAGGGDLYGGDLLFDFQPAFQSQGSENRFIIDFGVVDVLAAQHAYVFRSTGNAPIVGILQVETLFGGILGDGNLGIKFSSSGYFCYRNVINSNMAFGGNEIVTGSDPQGSGTGGQSLANKNFQIQMDGNTSYKINNPSGWNGFYGGVADMIPNAADYGIVTVPGTPSTRLGANKNTRSSVIIYPPTIDMNGFSCNYAANLTIFSVPTTGAAGNAGIHMASASTILFGLGFGGVGSQLVGGAIFGEDLFIIGAATTDFPLVTKLVPHGTSERTTIRWHNNTNWLFTQTYAALDIEVTSALCNIMLKQVAAVTPITTMNIGGDATSGLTTINFNLANVAIAYINNTGIVIPSDTDGLFVGATQDASIIYDGADLQIDVSLQNPSDIDVTCGANKTIELQNTVWDDVMVPGLSVTPIPATAPTLGAWLGAGGLQVYLFIGTGVLINEVVFTVQFPHTYKEGTDVYPHVHWGPVNANAGNVVWQLEYSWANIGATFPASTTITVTDAASGTAWDHQVAPYAAISGTGKTISSMMVCRLFRDPAHGSDTYGSNAGFLQFDVHHEINTMGSRQEFVK